MSGDLAKRQAYLDQLRRILAPSAPWEAWLEKSGELPPDFDAMPSHFDLPDPLEGVETPEQWPARREELKNLFKQWIIGSVPPPPDNLHVASLEEKADANATVRNLVLTFGPEDKAALRVELIIPPGEGPFPVFLTQSFHREWSLIAVRRGYIACVYAGSDDADDTDTFAAAYPEYDWSRITQRAWAASRCIDYLQTVPQADVSKIAITGHSRNGKLSLIASALDERIAIVIESSSGAGGVLTTRYSSEQQASEGIELMTRNFPSWFHPRWRFFVGREQKLPIDLHELVALSAPRPCLFTTALNDNVESTWSLQQTYLAAQRVYRFLDAEPNLRIIYRPGRHETWPLILEQYLDWCDTHFGRGTYHFPERLIHPQNWNDWQAKSGITINPVDWSQHNEVPSGSVSDWEKRRTGVRENIQWMLGENPPEGRNIPKRYSYDIRHIATTLEQEAPNGVEKMTIEFGEHLYADVYRQAGSSGVKQPAVLWLHPFSFSNGYVPAYKRGMPAYISLARAGFAVFCFDQIGHGLRIEEVEHFYQRHPRWSLLGKMVRDTRAALDAIEQYSLADSNRIYAVGYSMGSMVGLHTAALDERLSGMAVAGIPPLFRLDTDANETGGIQRWSHLHMLIPQLGAFIGSENRVPYDVDDLLSAFAPRPLLVVSPQLDREAPLEVVTESVNSARSIYSLYGAADRIEQQAPEAYNHFDEGAQKPVIAWLKGLAGLGSSRFGE